MTVCMRCNAALPDGPQELHPIEPDADRFPLSAAREKPFSYRLCLSCDASLGPDDRAEFETAIIAGLETALLLEQFLGQMTEQAYRTDPALQNVAEAALAVHKQFQADASASFSRFLLLAAPFRSMRPGVRALLGEGWLLSIEALIAAHEAALRESQQASALIRSRLSGFTAPSGPGA